MDIVDSLQFLLKGVIRSAPHPALFTWSPTSPSHSASVLLTQHPHLRAFVWSLLLLLWKLLPQTITWFPPSPFFIQVSTQILFLREAGPGDLSTR